MLRICRSVSRSPLCLVVTDSAHLLKWLRCLPPVAVSGVSVAVGCSLLLSVLFLSTLVPHRGLSHTSLLITDSIVSSCIFCLSSVQECLSKSVVQFLIRVICFFFVF